MRILLFVQLSCGKSEICIWLVNNSTTGAWINVATASYSRERGGGGVGQAQGPLAIWDVMLSEIPYTAALSAFVQFPGVICHTKAKTCFGFSPCKVGSLIQGFHWLSDNVGMFYLQNKNLLSIDLNWTPANMDTTSVYLFNLCLSP